jgi:transcription elongation factor Elf1
MNTPEDTSGDEMQCPWCGHNQSDPWEYSDGEVECGECEKPFTVSIDRSVTYRCRAITRLSDGRFEVTG